MREYKCSKSRKGLMMVAVIVGALAIEACDWNNSPNRKRYHAELAQECVSVSSICVHAARICELDPSRCKEVMSKCKKVSKECEVVSKVCSGRFESELETFYEFVGQ